MSDIPSNLSKWEPSRTLKILFLLFVVLCFAALYGAKIYSATVVYEQKMEAAIRADRTSGPAPGFKLKDARQQEVSLESLRGKVVFLNFWATWCGPCREEMPSLAELARQMDPQTTVFLAVSVDEGWPEVKEFLGGGPLPFKVVLDDAKSVSKSYGTNQFPETYVINPEGQLVYKFIGARDWTNVAAIKLLEKVGARRLPMAAKS